MKMKKCTKNVTTLTPPSRKLFARVVSVFFISYLQQAMSNANNYQLADVLA